MDEQLTRRLIASGYDRPGFAADYDRYRPQPPSALAEFLLPLLGWRPRLVVDLGSGTGLSTRYWAEHADEIVGVEPNDAMRALAEQATPATNVRYVGASAYATGLANESVDLVTAAQSFHWMQPDRVLPEIGRILRPGGVLCVYQYVALQTPLWEPEEAWGHLLERKANARTTLGLDADLELWPPTTERLVESGVFRHVRELAMHSREEGDGDRLVNFALSEGSLLTLLDAGVSEEEVGLDRLRVAASTMREPVPWWLAYRVWMGLR